MTSSGRRSQAAMNLQVALEANQLDLLRYLERRAESPAEAADALSDALLAAWRNVARLPAVPVEARMWLFTLTRNAHLNYRKKRRRRDAALSRLQESVGLERRRDTAEQVGISVDVRRAIGQLPDDLAELVRLVHWEQFSLVEAAQILGVPAATARSRYARAKTSLRAHLIRSDGEEPSKRVSV